MPHITVDGTDTRKQIKSISIHAEVVFAIETFNSPKASVKLKEIKEKIEKLVEEYFDVVESDTHTNHQWNTRMEDN